MAQDGSGKLYNVGHYGYSWTSSVTAGSYAYRLHFNPDGFNPGNDYHRSYGFQLRCLQE